MDAAGRIKRLSQSSEESLKKIVKSKARRQDDSQFDVSNLIYLIANAEFDFNWDKLEFLITNNEQLFEGLDSTDFEDGDAFDAFVQKTIADINSEVKKIFAKSKKDLAKELKFYKGKNDFRPEAKEVIHVYSPLRSVHKKYSLETYFSAIVNNMLINQMICEFIEEAGYNRHEFYKELRPKFSKSGAGSTYLRDDCVVVDGKFFHVAPEILREVDSNSGPGSRAVETLSEKSSAFKADAKENKIFDENAQIPFLLEGGNIIFCKDKDGKKTMLFSISDYHFDKNGNYQGGSFLKDGKIVSLGIDEYCAEIKKWANENGFEAVEVRRDVGGKNTMRDLYHLDVFCNVAQLHLPDGVAKNFLFLPEEGVIEKASEARLIELFGDENIIRTSEEDRKKLASNFIQVGNCLILSHPEISEEFVKQLTKIGFDVIVPPIILEMGDRCNDGVRCHTAVAPISGKNVGGNAAFFPKI